VRAREFQVRIALDDPEKRLRPGLSALAEIVVARKQGVPRVVPEALVPDPSSASPGSPSPQGGQAVFVVRDGRAALQRVGTGLVGDDFVEVTGLAAGSTVVVGPYRTVRTLREGQALQETARPQTGAP
jgi:HlyD family secretion protein